MSLADLSVDSKFIASGNMGGSMDSSSIGSWKTSKKSLERESSGRGSKVTREVSRRRLPRDRMDAWVLGEVGAMGSWLKFANAKAMIYLLVLFGKREVMAVRRRRGKEAVYKSEER